jgi:Cupin-like domain
MGLLELRREVFAERFNKRYFELRHALAGHPLFELPRLIELANATAAERRDDLYYDAGVSDLNERWGTSRCALPIDETIRRIETAGAFIILKRAETDRAYAGVLDECMAELLEVSGAQMRRQMRRPEAIIFITSPRRISTYHIDSETNFLLQVRGEKDISIFSKYDREVLPEEEIERFWTVDRNAAVYKPQYQARADVVRLVPGNGVHIPVNCPHWVQNDDNVSVSVSINYHSWNREYADLYCANYYLRKKLKLTPTPPWQSPLLDAVKRPVGALILKYKDARYGPLRKE